MQTHDLSILECNRCHYRTIRAIKQCPVCRQEDFHAATPQLKPAILQEALAFHAHQALRLSLLAPFFSSPWRETLQALGDAQRELAEGLGYRLEPSSELESLLQQAITAEFQDLPRLAAQAHLEGETELATQLKWLAARQGEIVGQLGQLRNVMQNPQLF